MFLQSSWCFEVHSNCWLRDLKVGEATKILHEEEKVFILICRNTGRHRQPMEVRSVEF